ncbi:MAG: undecaprenyl-diphosphate phosphatase [Ignavibacteriales bacterium]
MISWIVLGLVQGITEFLPVSSSGHLVIAQGLFNLHSAGIGIEVAAHLGTLAAVLTVYGGDAISLAVGFLSGLVSAGGRRRPGFRAAAFVLLGSIPAGVAGIVWKDAFERMFESPVFAGLGLLLTGFVLFVSGRGSGGRRQARGLSTSEMGPGRAFIVGVSQALAIAPGVSRSGMTISAGLASGLRGEEAARFSFLLSIPATAGAALLGVRDYLNAAVDITGAAGTEEAPLAALAIVAIVAFVSGTVALRYLIGLLRKGGLKSFAYYCWAAGAVALWMGMYAR